MWVVPSSIRWPSAEIPARQQRGRKLIQASKSLCRSSGLQQASQTLIPPRPSWQQALRP